MSGITMRDIGRQLGVSAVTVSKALAGKSGVSEEMRQKIIRRASELGYVNPNAPQTTPTSGLDVGILIPENFFSVVSFYATFYKQLVQALTDALATSPQVDSALMSKIGAAGGAQVSMVLTGYDAATGALQFDAQSGSVIDIPSYVLKLQKTGLFRKVDYTGYTYEDGVYVLSLNCILLGEEAAE